MEGSQGLHLEEGNFFERMKRMRKDCIEFFEIFVASLVHTFEKTDLGREDNAIKLSPITKQQSNL